MVTRDGLALLFGRNKIDQETFRAGMCSASQSIVQARGRILKNGKFRAWRSYRPLITAAFQKPKLKFESVQHNLLIHLLSNGHICLPCLQAHSDGVACAAAQRSSRL